MTVEDALIAFLAVVAGILLFIGLAQALDSRPPRPGRRRSRAAPDSPPYRLRSGAASAPPCAAAHTSGESHEDVPARSGEPIADNAEARPAAGGGMPRPASPVPPAEQPGLEPVQVEAPAQTRVEPGRLPDDPRRVEHAPPRALSAAAAPGEPSLAPVESSSRLFLAGRYADVLAAAEPRLGEATGGAQPSHAMTALWSVVALSRQALGDDKGAEDALAAALGALPAAVSGGCPPALAAMSVPIARHFFEWAERSPEGADARLFGPKLAGFWLRWRLIAAPGDDTAEALLDTAHAAVAHGHAGAITALIGHQQWREAGRAIDLARDAGELPEDRADLLREVLAASLRREIERLTAPILRGAKNESRALAALERGESTLASLHDLALPVRQRLAMNRRLWRGYARLGMARLDAGSLDAATEALLHALGMPDIGPRRQRHVRDAVAKAIETAGDDKVDQVTKLLAAGDRPAALEQVDGFVALIQRARQGGVPDKQLAVASSKARVLAHLLEPVP